MSARITAAIVQAEVAADLAGGRERTPPGARVGWEHRMPLARPALHDSGEDIHVAVWTTVHEMHPAVSRRYAFGGRCCVLAAGA